jgi:hypothetical protein
VTALLALAASLAPANVIGQVSISDLVMARNRWIIAVHVLGTLWLFTVEPWLALMSTWYLLSWRGPEQHPSLITWLAIGTSWFLLRSIPADSYRVIAQAWVVIALWQIGLIIYRAWAWSSPYARLSLGPRMKGSFGSPPPSALYLALVLPFAPVWLWPAFAAGLYFCFSWHAFACVAAALAVLYPRFAWVPLGLFAGAMLLWAASRATQRLFWSGQRLLEWTPRGDSWDSVRARLALWTLIPRLWWTGPSRWLGRGPYTLHDDHARWSVKGGVDLNNGEAHMELLHQLYEYGALGVLAVVAFCYRVGGVHGQLGDAWTAAWVAGVVATLGHWPARHPALGVTWLAIAAGVVR